MGALDKKVAIVTGSSSGIGAGIAAALAGEGASVLVNSVRSVEAGEVLASQLPGAAYFRADVSVEAEAQALVAAAIERWGRLDIVANNAGTTTRIPHRDLASVTEQVWMDIFRTNVLGNWFVTKAAEPHLRASGNGVVINVSSAAGVVVGGSSVPYAVSKAGINHMTRLLAVALGPEIRVNAVAPGLVHTPWTEEWGVDFDAFGQQNPLGRLATPEDVGTAVLGLIAAEAVTGAVLVVDGGRHLGATPMLRQ